MNLEARDPGLAHRPRIMLLDKHGKRRIENVHQIASALAADFPVAEVVVQDGRSFALLGIREQVRIISYF